MAPEHTLQVFVALVGVTEEREHKSRLKRRHTDVLNVTGKFDTMMVCNKE